MMQVTNERCRSDSLLSSIPSTGSRLASPSITQRWGSLVARPSPPLTPQSSVSNYGRALRRRDGVWPLARNAMMGSTRAARLAGR